MTGGLGPPWSGEPTVGGRGWPLWAGSCAPAATPTGGYRGVQLAAALWTPPSPLRERGRPTLARQMHVVASSRPHPPERRTRPALGWGKRALEGRRCGDFLKFCAPAAPR